MVAAREGRSELVELLLTAGADPNHVALDRGLGLTPLHAAASGGDAGIVRRLAAADAALDARDADGVVPMLWALADRRLDCVLALIELGADPELASERGQSVAGLAREHGIQPVLEAIAGRR
jgi:ankyrin repeat protein